MRTVDDYIALVPGFNADKARFIATLRALLQPLADGGALLRSMPDAFDLDTAVGAQLDADGVRIGRDRYVDVPVEGWFSFDVDGLGFDQGYWQGAFDPDTGVSSLDDDTYRLLLKARAMANGWDGTTESALAIYTALLGPAGYQVQIIDGQDMTMTVRFFGPAPDPRTKAIIEGGYLGLKPAGVTVTYQFQDFFAVATFSRASTALYFDEGGTLTSVNADVPRRV